MQDAIDPCDIIAGFKDPGELMKALRNLPHHYKAIGGNPDELYGAPKNPEELMAALRGPLHDYKVTRGGQPTYHLGGDFYRDPDGTLCWGAKTYIKRLVGNYERLFGEKPKDATCPLDKDDHPELDGSPFLEDEDITKYQSLIGALQWAITLCRFDIATAVMTLGRYRCALRKGHLIRVKRVVGYLKANPEGAIRFRTHIPDHSKTPIAEYSWLHTVYGNTHEELPPGMPEPKGKPVRTTT
jgi:hypothetical protein